ncbi:MAG: hypothetical protein A2252_00685 [Elusimicrobia bacterium RIFOXYA2_FULL_39_19]|nr:MAG: hypothetical protein A2252_00685 [Elusimicrobia bacterium RIFOXYA2_FULL_39_19]
MRKMFSFVLLCFMLVSCDALKGPKGDNGAKGDTGTTGSSGLISTQLYSGTPTSNPYSVSCPVITDLSKQIVEVYAYTPYPQEIIPLPLSGAYELHLYEFYPNLQTIALMSSYTNTNPATSPATALKLSNGTQMSYRIYVKTFSTTSALQAYQRQGTTGEYLKSFCPNSN